uniref:BHLH domain-containing protein n=1 Tax=Syphacia muris TaxID=451379 RepID=A0A0N5A889_9BILA
MKLCLTVVIDKFVAFGGHHNNFRPSTSNTRPVLTLSNEERAELQQLAQMVPVTSSRNISADPCAILHAAALYIDQLRATVAARVKNGTLPRVEVLHVNRCVVQLIRKMGNKYGVLSMILDVIC